jgi:hypothetical protein
MRSYSARFFQGTALIFGEFSPVDTIKPELFNLIDAGVSAYID